MFLRTLFIGGVVGLLTSFIVKSSEYSAHLSPFNIMELIGLVLFFTGFGLVFAVVSQTGFFAYLFIHLYDQCFFRSYWTTVQLLIIIFVIFDLIYFPYKGANGEIPLITFILMTAYIAFVALIVARIKAKKTNPTAFIPTLFVMIVITALEWSLVLRTTDLDYMLLTLMPLLATNAYQILILHEVTKMDEEQKRKLTERRERLVEKQRAKMKKKKSKNKNRKK